MSHVITSSYNHFIIMRTHRWPYGPCFWSILCSCRVRDVGFFLPCRVGVSGHLVGSPDMADPTWKVLEAKRPPTVKK